MLTQCTTTLSYRRCNTTYQYYRFGIGTYIASNIMDYGTYTKTARTQDGTASHKPVTRRTAHPSPHKSALDADTFVVRSVGHSKESHRIIEKDAFHPTTNRRIQPRDASSHEINKPDQLIGLVQADDVRYWHPTTRQTFVATGRRSILQRTSLDKTRKVGIGLVSHVSCDREL